MNSFKLWLRHQWARIDTEEPVSVLQANDPVHAAELYAIEHATESVVELAVQDADGRYLEICLVNKWELDLIACRELKDLKKPHK